MTCVSQEESILALPCGARSGLDHCTSCVNLVATLTADCETLRVPIQAGDLRPNYGERPGELEQLVRALLEGDRARPVAATAALKGAGGYGKTTLAKAVCHHPRIQEEFHDGILWVVIGQNPTDLTTRIIDLIEALTDERSGFASTRAASARLAEELGERNILLVIDDVWNGADAEPFLTGGKRSARLITTRMQEAVPANATAIKVAEMQEAVALLGKGLPPGGNDQALKRMHKWRKELGPDKKPYRGN